MPNLIYACLILMSAWLTGLFTTAVGAADNTYPIGDLTAIKITIADLPAEATAVGIDKEALSAAVAGELKKGGVEILEEEGAPGTGTFIVSVGAVKASGDDVACAVRCEAGRLCYYFKKGDLEKSNPIVGKQFVRGGVWVDLFAISANKDQAKGVVLDAVRQCAEKFAQDQKADQAAAASEAPTTDAKK